MPPRFSIWMVLAGVMAGVLAGFLGGSGVIGDSRLARRKMPDLGRVREEFSRQLSGERRTEILRAFDAAVRRAGEK